MAITTEPYHLSLPETYQHEYNHPPGNIQNSHPGLKAPSQVNTIKHENDSAYHTTHRESTAPTVTCTTYNGSPMAIEQPSAEYWKNQAAGLCPVRHLVLKETDQAHRIEGAPSKFGYCVDELCACHKHQCLPPRPNVPFNADTTYRVEYVAKNFPKDSASNAQIGSLDANGVPIGIDLKAWKEFIAKNGPTAPDKLPSYLFYKTIPDTRDFSTENRTEYTPKDIPNEKNKVSIITDANGVPQGVDPKVWKEYIAKHGFVPPGKIPAHLFRRPIVDNRDFSTENRTEYVQKDLGTVDGHGIPCNADGVPYGVDPNAWKAYIAKHGTPPQGSIPASLLYRPAQDNRDFVTSYRKDYTPFTVDVCPLTRLPPYPVPVWPREHTFWDPVAKQWY